MFKYEELDSIVFCEGFKAEIMIALNLVSKPMAYNVVFSFGDDDSQDMREQAGE
jgi:hypothetical protein